VGKREEIKIDTLFFSPYIDSGYSNDLKSDEDEGEMEKREKRNMQLRP